MKREMFEKPTRYKVHRENAYNYVHRGTLSYRVSRQHFTFTPFVFIEHSRLKFTHELPCDLSHPVYRKSPGFLEKSAASLLSMYTLRLSLKREESQS